MRLVAGLLGFGRGPASIAQREGLGANAMVAPRIPAVIAACGAGRQRSAAGMLGHGAAVARRLHPGGDPVAPRVNGQRNIKMG